MYSIYLKEIMEIFGPLSFRKTNYNLNYYFLLNLKKLMCIVQDQRVYQVLSYIILKLGSQLSN